VKGGRPAREDFERRKRHPYDKLKQPWQLLWRCLIAVLVGFFLAWASEKIVPPSEAVKRPLAKAYLPWLTSSDTSPIEGLLPRVLLERTSYPPAVRDEEVLVLSIDDADLESMGIKWPPDLSVYAWMIEQLQRDGARAIFLDILLIDPRPKAQVDALQKAACDAAGAGIPVFLASIPGQVVTDSPETLLREPQDVDGNGKKRPCIELVSPFKTALTARHGSTPCAAVECLRRRWRWLAPCRRGRWREKSPPRLAYGRQRSRSAPRLRARCTSPISKTSTLRTSRRRKHWRSCGPPRALPTTRNY
jgi:CHASE2 domain